MNSYMGEDERRARKMKKIFLSVIAAVLALATFDGIHRTRHGGTGHVGTVAIASQMCYQCERPLLPGAGCPHVNRVQALYRRISCRCHPWYARPDFTSDYFLFQLYSALIHVVDFGRVGDLRFRVDLPDNARAKYAYMANALTAHLLRFDRHLSISTRDLFEQRLANFYAQARRYGWEANL